MSGSNALSTTGDSINGATVEIILTNTLTASDMMVTVELDADAVKDVAGNGIDAVAETAVTLVDNTAPTLTSAAIAASPTLADTIILIYNESLDSSSTPATSAFTVKVEGVTRTVTNIQAGTGNGTLAQVTFSPAARPGETVTVSYAKPVTNPLKDAANNEAVSFTDFAVNNNLAATAPEAPGNLAASPGADAGTMALTWDTPWHNGSDITEFEVRYAAGTSVPPIRPPGKTSRTATRPPRATR